MRGVESVPGEQVHLHFFEDRYKILIRRTWEGNRRFLCTQTEPEGGMTGLIVEVDQACFLPDGSADIYGHGVELVTLGRVWVEEGTHGLFYSEMRPREPCEQRAKRILIRAIRQGAPQSNRAEALRCVTAYLEAAQLALPEAPHGLSERLQRAIHEANDLLPAAVAAARLLRASFEEVLQMSSASPSQTLQAGAVHLELPVFYASFMPLPANGQVIELRLFENQFCALAREVWSNPERLFLFSDGEPQDGAEATLMRLKSCKWHQGAAMITSNSIDSVSLGAVRQDSAKFGLFYASCIFQSVHLGFKAQEIDSLNKCCVLQ